MRASTLTLLALLLGLLPALDRWVERELLPDLDAQLAGLETWRPPTVCRVHDAAGGVVDEFSLVRRIWVPLDELPDVAWQAVIAAEDRRFFRHGGVDLLGIARAVAVNLAAGEIREGGSTLTQQLVKNVVVGSEKSYARKAREALLAWRLEQMLDKRRILELYVNYIYLGSGNYGLEAAAQDYFGVSAREIDAGQAALLAGLVPAPSAYSPRRRPEVAKHRRRLVLDGMVSAGLLDVIDAQLAKKQPIQPPVYDASEAAPGTAYFTAVRREVRRLLGDEVPFEAGLSVYTSFRPAVQAAAERALEEAAQGVERRQARAGAGGRPAADAPFRADGAVVVLDNATGAVVAMVGGRDMPLEGFNRATQALRQAGSSFKPYVYAAALERGRTAVDDVLDAPLALPGAGGRVWSPQNYSGGFAGVLPLRSAFARSLNTVAVRLALETGVGPVADLARRAGVSTRLRRDITLALGSSEVTVLDQAVGVSTFVRGGIPRGPVYVQRLVDVRGRDVGQAGERVRLDGVDVVLPGNPGRPAMSPATAWQVVELMRATVEEGTARSAWVRGRDRGGKTGTSSNYADAWFVGFTPAHTVAVWIGRDDRGSLGDGETGGRAALPVWRAVVEALGEDPADRLVPPPEVALVPWRDRWIGLPADRMPQEVLPWTPPPSDAPLPAFPSPEAPACDATAAR